MTRKIVVLDYLLDRAVHVQNKAQRFMRVTGVVEIELDI